MRVALIFSMILVLVVCGAVCQVFSEAPTTPKILFTSERDGNREVYMMNPDGSEQVNLTQHPATDLEAAWSPTGEQILFVSDREGTRDLYLMDADGSNVRRVFKQKIDVWRTAPTWSPDSKQFVYQIKDWNFVKGGLYLATFGEEDAEFIGKYNTPEWSPNDPEIVCSDHHGPGAKLTFINIHTREVEQPLPIEALLWQFEVSWSAAGDRLAFAGNRHPLPVILDRGLHRVWKNKQTIYIVNRDGTGLRQLVDEDDREVWFPELWSPELSPDGSEVLYTEGPQIFKVDVNSGIRTLMTNFGRNFGGDWFDPTYELPVSPQPDLLTTTWGEMKRK